MNFVNIFQKYTITYSIYVRMKSLVRNYKMKKKYNNECQIKIDKHFIISSNKNYSSGLCALINLYLGEISFAERYGFKVIIDLQTFKNSLIDEEDFGSVNAWESFFLQPSNMSLNEIPQTGQIIVSDAKNGLLEPTWAMGFLKNKHEIKKWIDIFDKNVVFNQETKLYLEEQLNCILKHPEETIGCLCRGTDYTSLKPSGHPIQPDIGTLIRKVRETMDKYDYKYVFLATEDCSVLEKFEKEFKEKLVYDNSMKYNDTGKQSLPEIKRNRERDRYQSTREYLATLYILSHCDSLVAGRTSASPVILFMNKLRYKCYYFFDCGLY